MKKITKREAFRHLLKIAKWALRVHYVPHTCRVIEHSFRHDPVEIIYIAARALHNAIRNNARAAAKEPKP